MLSYEMQFFHPKLINKFNSFTAISATRRFITVLGQSCDTTEFKQELNYRAVAIEKKIPFSKLFLFFVNRFEDYVTFCGFEGIANTFLFINYLINIC